MIKNDKHKNHKWIPDDNNKPVFIPGSIYIEFKIKEAKQEDIATFY